MEEMAFHIFLGSCAAGFGFMVIVLVQFLREARGRREPRAPEINQASRVLQFTSSRPGSR